MATTTLTEADDGAEIVVRPGDEVVVQLDENATTGYRWQVERLEGPAALAADGYVPVDEPPTVSPDEAIVGRGGRREFRIHVTGPGRVELALRHWQEWSGEGSVIARFRATVRCVEDPAAPG